ncbi:MAG: carbohydrate-binding domain-containing protein [Mycobacterium sp.]
MAGWRVDHTLIGRVGALAVMLGVGVAVVATAGTASADNTDVGSPESTTERAQEPRPNRDGASSNNGASSNKRGAGDRDERRSSRNTRESKRNAEKSGRDADDDTPAGNSSTAGNPRQSSTTVDIETPSTTSPAPDSPQAPAAPVHSTMLLTAASASARRPSEVAPAAATTTGTTELIEPAEDEVIEAESMVISRSRNGATYTDSLASGGSAVVLNKNASLKTTATLAEFSSLVIRARGDQYRGAPTMKVSVNGNVVSTVAVTATTWTDYTIDYSAPAGTYTVTVAFTNDLYSRKYGDRNLRLDNVTAVAAAITPPPPPPGGTSGPGYFAGADWLWNPIGANPVLDANSATWVSYLAATDAQRVANLYEYSVAMVSASEITSGTPRYDVTLTQPWGNDPFGSTTVPIPVGTEVPPGSDGHLAILDPTTGKAYGIWQAAYDSATDTWSGSWGGMTDLNGNGIDQTGSATAAAIARYAGVVTAEEFSAAVAANTGLGHALAFSTDLAGPDFVYPAIKSDGQNWAGVATPIPEGYRIQLDPSLDIDAMAGMTAGEKVIAKTLQTHGAYVVDQGGARMAFAFELVDDATSSSPGSVWTDAGFAWDYYDMNGIPWSGLRVLAPTTVTV